MKTITLLLVSLFVGVTASANISSNPFSPRNYGESFIFVEGGVEFAVYPNGEFDFHYNPQFINTSIAQIPNPNMNISYNAGHNYGGFVQYDDFGAVIQIENIPIFYDYYGRIIQAGNVLIDYNSRGNVARIGGMQVRYNMFNQPVRYIGFINYYNSRYVYRPWHQYYMRPHVNYSVVYYEPYRAYYQPVRMDYIQYNTYYQNNTAFYNKNNFYRPGQQATVYNHGRRTTSQVDLSPTVRSSENVRRTRTAEVNNTNATVRRNAETSRTANNRSSMNNETATRERVNMQQHEAAVNSRRNSTAVNNQMQTRRTTINNNAAINAQVRGNNDAGRSTIATEPQARIRPEAATRNNASNVQVNSSRTSYPAANVNTQRASTNRASVRSQASATRSSAALPAAREASNTGATRRSGGRG